MNIQKKLRVYGWLPAGLVLNTRLMTYHAELNPLTPLIAQSGLVASGDQSLMINVWSLSQADANTMIRLKGRFLTPVVAGILNERHVEPAANWDATQFTDHVSVNPFSNPCVLLTAAQFDGEVYYYGGTDSPLSMITMDEAPDPNLENYQTCDYMLRRNTWILSYEVTMTTAVYLPQGASTQSLYAVHPDYRALMMSTIGSQFAKNPYLGEDIDPFGGANFVIKADEFRIADTAFLSLPVIRKHRYRSGYGSLAFHAVQLQPCRPLACRAFLTPDVLSSQFVCASDAPDKAISVWTETNSLSESIDLPQGIEFIMSRGLLGYRNRFLLLQSAATLDSEFQV